MARIKLPTTLDRKAKVNLRNGQFSKDELLGMCQEFQKISKKEYKNVIWLILITIFSAFFLDDDRYSPWYFWVISGGTIIVMYLIFYPNLILWQFKAAVKKGYPNLDWQQLVIEAAAFQHPTGGDSNVDN